MLMVALVYRRDVRAARWCDRLHSLSQQLCLGGGLRRMRVRAGLDGAGWIVHPMPVWQIQSGRWRCRMQRLRGGQVLRSEWGDGREHVLGVHFKLGRTGGE